MVTADSDKIVLIPIYYCYTKPKPKNSIRFIQSHITLNLVELISNKQTKNNTMNKLTK